MSIRPWLFAAAALACVCANAQHERARVPQPGGTAATSAAGSDLLPFRAAEKTLPNGLKIIVVRTGFPNIVSLQIPVQTGSRNEGEAGRSGFAPFFEHMR